MRRTPLVTRSLVTRSLSAVFSASSSTLSGAFAAAAALLSVLLAPGGPALAGEAVRYEVAGEAYEGYFAPAMAGKADAGLVLLLHDWDGLTDYEVRRADMLAELGYDVFAADLFGAGIRPTRVEDKRQHTSELYTDREKLRALMRGALDTAQTLGAARDRAVAMGYCFGGGAVLELARSGEALRGFVSFHGGLQTPSGQDYSRTRGAVAVYHGSADTAITMAQFAALAESLEAAGVAHEMTTYGGAPHAFTVFGSDRYREHADRHSWSAFLAFLEQYL